MRVRLLFSESIRSLGANLSTTVAATMTVLIGMFLLGLFIALGSWAQGFGATRRRSCSSRSSSAPRHLHGEATDADQRRAAQARGRSARQGRSPSCPRPRRSSACASFARDRREPPLEPAARRRSRSRPKRRRERRSDRASLRAPRSRPGSRRSRTASEVSDRVLTRRARPRRSFPDRR